MKMNELQRYVCIAVAIVIGLMLLFPPWHVASGNGVVRGLGHALLFDPPRARYGYGSVNVATLLLQWIGVLIVGAILFFIVKDKE